MYRSFPIVSNRTTDPLIVALNRDKCVAAQKDISIPVLTISNSIRRGTIKYRIISFLLVPKTAVFPGCLAAVTFMTKGLKVVLIEEKPRTASMRFDVIDIGCRRQLSLFEAMLAVGVL